LKDFRQQNGLLAIAELLRIVTLGLIAKSGDAVLVVADHPIPQGLAVHPGRPRRRQTRHAVQGIGDRHHPGCHTAILLPPRQGA